MMSLSWYRRRSFSLRNVREITLTPSWPFRWLWRGTWKSITVNGLGFHQLLSTTQNIKLIYFLNRNWHILNRKDKQLVQYDNIPDRYTNLVREGISRLPMCCTCSNSWLMSLEFLVKILKYLRDKFYKPKSRALLVGEHIKRLDLIRVWSGFSTV